MAHSARGAPWLERDGGLTIEFEGFDAELREADELESFRRSIGKAPAETPIAVTPSIDHRNRAFNPISASAARASVRLFLMMAAGFVAAFAAATLIRGAGNLTVFLAVLFAAAVVGGVDWYVCERRSEKLVHGYAKRFTFTFTSASFTLSAPRTVEQGFLLEEIASFEAREGRLVLILADGRLYPLTCSPNDIADLAPLADHLGDMLLRAKTEGGGYRGRVRIAPDAPGVQLATGDEVPDEDPRVEAPVKSKEKT